MSEESSTPKSRKADAPAAELLVVEHAEKRGLEKWKLSALLARNAAKQITALSKMTDADFEKALAEALGPI